MNVEGLSVVITGGGRGIGRALAGRFVHAGALVTVSDRDNHALDETYSGISASEGAVARVVADVADPVAAQNLVNVAVERYGRLDVAINNAAISSYEPFIEITYASWSEHLSTNLTGYFNVGQASARQMIAQQHGGRIINLASINSLSAERNAAHYAASKGGVAQLTRSMAFELASHDILVNAIAPGAVATEKTVLLAQNPAYKNMIASTPLKRAGTPDEIASVALFLASSYSSFLTGAIIVVDGGRLCALGQ